MNLGSRMDAQARPGRVPVVGPIGEVVARELGALLQAHNLLRLAQRRHSEAPGDRVLADRLAVAKEEKREAAALLKAALHARGYTYEQLQQELGHAESRTS